jgi:ribosomal protein L11 methyltransferase
VNSPENRKRQRPLAKASRGAPTFVARMTSGAQAAHDLADHLTEHFAGDDIAVSIAETGKAAWTLAVYFRAPRDRKRLHAAVAAAAGDKAARALRFSRLGEADWIAESLHGLAPVEAGRFLVHGAHDRGRVPINRVGIQIEAALAFGSGHHGTTRGCLLALDRMSKSLRKPKPTTIRRDHSKVRARQTKRPRLLDVGTGSGVLAIAAARTLHRPVIATDIDGEAVTVARENVRLNRVATLVRIEQANGLSAAGLSALSGFDVIFANILLAPLLRLAAPLRRRIAPGGRIVLSGLLRAQANAAIAAYRPLALERRIELDDWVTLVLVRRSRPRSPIPPVR